MTDGITLRSALMFDVLGVPAPQGSKKPAGTMTTSTGKTVTRLVESSKKVKPWREAVKAAADVAMDGAEPWDEPVAITLDLWMPRPAVKAAALWHPKYPDLDKLARSTFDGLKAGGVVRDDSLIVSVVATKRLVPHERGRRSTVPTGCRVAVYPIGVFTDCDVRWLPVLIPYEQAPTWVPRTQETAA